VECVGLARDKGEQGHNENDDYDGNCHQHLTIPHSMLRSDDSKTGNRGIGVTAKGQKRVSRAGPAATSWTCATIIAGLLPSLCWSIVAATSPHAEITAVASRLTAPRPTTPIGGRSFGEHKVSMSSRSP
jgi:hypothetical protein